MAIRFGIRHRSTRAWLTGWPSLGIIATTMDEAEAVSAATEDQAEQERQGLVDFAPSFAVEPLEVDTMADFLHGQGMATTDGTEEDAA